MSAGLAAGGGYLASCPATLQSSQDRQQQHHLPSALTHRLESSAVNLLDGTLVDLQILVP